jgi:hypothetical protein
MFKHKCLIELSCGKELCLIGKGVCLTKVMFNHCSNKILWVRRGLNKVYLVSSVVAMGVNVGIGQKPAEY